MNSSRDQLVTSPFQDLSDREWRNVQEWIQRIRISYNHREASVIETCTITVNLLWDFARQDRNKIALMHPSLKLLPLFKKMLESSIPTEMRRNVLGCLWYLSRHHKNCAEIGSREYGFLPIFMRGLQQENDEVCFNILYNVAFDPQVHDYLLCEEIGFLRNLKDRHFSIIETEYLHLSVAVMTCSIQKHHIPQLIELGLPQLAYRTIAKGGPNQVLSGGLPDHSVDILSNLSAFESCRTILRRESMFEFLLRLSESSSSHAIRVLVVLINLYCDQFSFDKNERNNHRQKRFIACIKSKEAPKISVIILSLQIGIKSSETKSLRFGYGTVMLRVVTLALLQLSRIGSIDIMTQLITVCDSSLLSLLETVITAYYHNTGFRSSDNSAAASISGGGGREDVISLTNVLELLIQLCQYYSYPKSGEEGSDELLYHGYYGEVLISRLRASKIHEALLLLFALTHLMEEPVRLLLSCATAEVAALIE